MRRTATVLALALAPTAASAQAVLEVAFTERVPADAWRVSNVAPCAGVQISEVRFNLATAAGPVFFDTAPGAPGYPEDSIGAIEFYSGRGNVTDVAVPEDGSRQALFTLGEFTAGDEFHVGLDVDSEDPEAPGWRKDVTSRDMEGTTVSALITNPAGETRAELGVMVRGVATVVWDLACVGADADPLPAQD